MKANPPTTLSRDVRATAIPSGTGLTLRKGEQADITQALGGSYTVVVGGNLYRIEPGDADALGFEITAQPATRTTDGPGNAADLEAEVWAMMRTCYDPEIPVNIVDLGLVYDCRISPAAAGSGHQVDIKMTLTAPGCGMGVVIAADVRSKLLSLEGIAEANVELVFEPQWNQEMISEPARLQLGLY